MQLSGLLSFPLTPFAENDTVDTEVLAEHIEAHVAAKPAGFFVACGTGEFTALSIEEYRTVVSTALRVVNGRMPVFSGVGGGPGWAVTRATSPGRSASGNSRIVTCRPSSIAPSSIASASR